MSYINRAGTIFSFPKTLLTLGLMSIVFIRSDWEHQQISFTKDFKFFVFNDMVTVIMILLGFSIITTCLWWIFSKYLGPSLGLSIARIYGGVKSKPFLDKKIKIQRVNFSLYIQRYFNLFILLFSLDFLFSNTIYGDGTNIPNAKGLFLAMLVITIVDPMIYTLSDLGLRLFKEITHEVISVNSILDRLILRTIQTSSLVASLVVISLDSDIINNIPVQIRVIFVRDFFVSSLVIFMFTTFFQADPVTKKWKTKKIPEGRVNVRFGKLPT